MVIVFWPWCRGERTYKEASHDADWLWLTAEGLPAISR